MIVSLVQPYFFPYLGYFQLIEASDVFVVYDDAQFMKSGWVNRNRILANTSTGYEWFTHPVLAAAHTLPINERSYVSEDGRYPELLLAKLHHRYRRAAFFRPTMCLAEEILSFRDRNVARFNTHLIRRICSHLAVATRIETASELRSKDSGSAQAVVDVCKQLGADTYLNPIGGTALYSSEFFAANALALTFLESEFTPYPQFDQSFQQGLSIIDILMFNSVDTTRKMLGQFRILRG
jgi:hypothetical protein